MENTKELIKKIDSTIKKIRNNDILPNKPSLIWSYLLRILNTRKTGRFNSSYVIVNNDNNRIITIRFSNHPANENNFLFHNADGDNISIIIDKPKNSHVNITKKISSVYQEIVYPISLFKKKKIEVVTEILYGIKSALECGEYKSKTGKFMGIIVVHRNIPKSLSGTSDRQRRMRMYKYKISLLNLGKKRLNDFGEKIGGSAKDRYTKGEKNDKSQLYVLPTNGYITKYPTYQQLTQYNQLSSLQAFSVLNILSHKVPLLPPYRGKHYLPDVLLSYVSNIINDNAPVDIDVKLSQAGVMSGLYLSARLKELYLSRNPNTDAEIFKYFGLRVFLSEDVYRIDMAYTDKSKIDYSTYRQYDIDSQTTIRQLADRIYSIFLDITDFYIKKKTNVKEVYKKASETRGYNPNTGQYEDIFRNEELYILKSKSKHCFGEYNPIPFIVEEGQDVEEVAQFLTSQPYHTNTIVIPCFRYCSTIYAAKKIRKRYRFDIDCIEIDKLPRGYKGTIHEYVIRNRHDLLTKANDILYPTFNDKEGLVASTRVGKDWRQGRNANEEDFLDVFGFRAVEFGETMPQVERLKNMNLAYDSFMDLAALFGFPPSVISLGGRLALSFGSRGRGGRNSASAHYEKNKEVINLTRTRGAGSLAHEWFHALDYSLSRSNKFSSGILTSYDNLGDFYNTKSQINMLNIYKVIVGSHMYKDSSVLQKSVGTMQNGSGYWTQEPELFARAFESVVYHMLKDNEQTNEYLVQLPIQQTGKVYPYPHQSDLENLKHYYTLLFDGFIIGKHKHVFRDTLYGTKYL